VFGYFGQINQFKGVDVLLRACDLLAKRKDLAGRLQIRVHGNLVGQAPGFVERFEKATSAYPFLSYAGPYSNSMVRELMSACDYVVVPSTWWENSPLVIQEAYAARCPVVCSGIGGMAEKVADGATGLHFRPGDAADLLRALSAAMDEAAHGALAARLPAPITDEEMALQYLDCFRAAAQQGAGADGAPADVPAPLAGSTTRARPRPAASRSRSQGEAAC
jgi:glycosyltransferase involved in cell wall biosynthesis